MIPTTVTGQIKTVQPMTFPHHVKESPYIRKRTPGWYLPGVRGCARTYLPSFRR